MQCLQTCRALTLSMSELVFHLCCIHGVAVLWWSCIYDLGVGVLFKSVRTLMWPQNCQMSIFRSIHLQHWYPNVNIQIDPFATLVPKLPNVNIQIDPFATLVPKLPNVNILIDPFATLVPKCQYSDRIHSQSGWLGPQSEYNHLAGAAIRTRNHNYEDRNYDLNAHPHIIKAASPPFF